MTLEKYKYKEIREELFPKYQDTTVQQLHEELQQQRDNQALASDLIRSVKALKQTLPASVPNHCLISVLPSLLCTQPNNTLATPDTPTQPAVNSQICPSQPLSTQPEEQAQEQAPQVVLLADSNGKFLDTNKLFPGKKKKVLLICGSTTGQARQ